MGSRSIERGRLAERVLDSLLVGVEQPLGRAFGHLLKRGQQILIDNRFAASAIEALDGGVVFGLGPLDGLDRDAVGLDLGPVNTSCDRRVAAPDAGPARREEGV